MQLSVLAVKSATVLDTVMTTDGGSRQPGSPGGTATPQVPISPGARGMILKDSFRTGFSVQSQLSSTTKSLFPSPPVQRQDGNDNSGTI